MPGSEQPVNHRPTLTFEYDEMGNRTAETSALGNAVDPDGYKIEYEYDRLGRLLKTIAKATDPFTGEKEVIVTKHYYDPAGNRIKTVDPNNGEWKYDYSARGWLVREEDPEGNVTRYRYDRVGNKTHETDPRGSENRDAFTTVYHYDDLNRLYLTEFPDGTSVEFAYDPAGNKIMERDANQVQTTYVYDARNRVEKVFDNRGRLQLEYKYDPKGNLIEEKDALNNITRREYDSLGRLRRVIYPAGNRESFSYDALGNRTEVADGRGNITRYTYNSLGWLTTIRDPLWNVTEYRYDPNGNMVVMVAANGLTTVNRYDELNRLVERTDPPGFTTLFSYDGVGNLLRKKDPRDTIWNYEYFANHLLKKLHLTGADNSEYEVRYQYDAAGNRRLVVDSNNTIRYNYDETGQYKPDPLNRINSVDRYFDGASYRTEYRYDPAGLLTGIKYPDAQAWLEYKYNNLNQLQEVVGFTAPQGITYETDGVVSSLNLSNNIVTAFNYDNNRRLLQLVTSGPEEILKLDYAYDENNNIIRLNDRLYQYDARNQLTRAYTPDRFLEEEKTPGNLGIQSGDYLGRTWLNFYTDPGAVVGIDYNASSIGIDFGHTVPAVKKIVLAPGKEYQDHRVRAETLDLFYSNDNSTYMLIPRENWTYVQDENGVITLTLEETLSARYLKVHVKFDDRDLDFNPVDRATFLNELAKMLRVYQEASSRTEEYQYDAVGNRTELRLELVQTFYYTYSYYENSDRLKTDGKYAYAYDAAGNLVKKGNTFTISGETVNFVISGEEVEYWEYEYDLLNRLIAVRKNGAVVAEYGYDPEGFRVIRRARGETTHYVFEGTEPVFEKNITTGEQRSYVFALGKYLARVDGAIGDPEAPV